MKNLEWLKKSKFARQRLFCFPYAGSGPSAFRPWISFIPDDCDLIAVQLPGRERRLGEKSYTDINKIIIELMETIPEYLELPYQFFGHSMGALIAYELIVRLQFFHQPLPKTFFASGCVAPSNIHMREKMAHLDDRDFVVKLRSYEGTPDSILNNPELLEILLPRLRADLHVLENYQFKETPFSKIRCPFYGLYGENDSHIPFTLFSPWKDFCQNDQQIRGFLGGHFFLNSFRLEIIKLLFPKATLGISPQENAINLYQ